MLFACLFVPDFAVQAALRINPQPIQINRPVAVLDGPTSLPRVVALNEAARQAGIEIGMTMLQAAAANSVLLHKRVPAQEEAAQQALLDCARSFSPAVESTALGTVIADLSGVERLLGSPQKMGRELAASAAAMNFEVHVALAANPDAALVAARGFSGATVIPSGEEAVRLGALPIEVLAPAAEIFEVLESWGIRTCKALALLPPVPLSERLGEEGLRLQRLARGENQRHLFQAEDELAFIESTELEEAIELLEPLSFILNRLLEQLTERLRARSLATSEVTISLHLERHEDRELQECGRPEVLARYERTLKIPVATQDSIVLLKLLQLELSAHPPEAAVKKIRIQAEPAQVRQSQAGLFMPAAPEPEKLEILLARMRAIVGERDEQGRKRVGSPCLLDSHRPDAFEVMHFVPPAAKEKSQPANQQPRAALRRFRPSMKAAIEAQAAVPAVVSFDGKRLQVLAAAGPWRSSGEWWNNGSGWQREEWDLALATKSGTGIYRVYRDLKRNDWFVDGIYD